MYLQSLPNSNQRDQIWRNFAIWEKFSQTFSKEGLIFETFWSIFKLFWKIGRLLKAKIA
jgi:hypothetical protein